jgi:hypothetical protein
MLQVTLCICGKVDCARSIHEWFWLGLVIEILGVVATEEP